MDARFLHGLETEYSFTQFAEGGEVLDRRAGLHGLFLMARKRLESLPDASSSGLFLGNGSRFYLDAGNHPELCTPECTDPWQLVRYLKAGEAILMDLAKELDKPQLGVKLMRTAFFRSNVDYFTRATWGCHESYQYRSRASAMSHELVPHLVSRIVYTGAGGFDDRSPGLEFLVSPRVAHLERVSSDDSTAARGIFHTKDEPLSRGGWHRLHVLCGESLCGEVGSFLKVATTALIVRLIEHDACDGAAVRPCQPLASMKTFAADPSCADSVAINGDRRMTAVEIQRHYLAAAESSLGRPYMPDWASDVCRLWRTTLDRLERHEGAREVVDGEVLEPSFVLDWAIKRQLYVRHAEQHGFTEAEIARHNRLAQAATRELGSQPAKLSCLATVSKTHVIAREIEPTLQRYETPLEEFQAFLALRAELCEIDTRFGELGEHGVHTALARSGAIVHDLERVGSAWLPEGIPGIHDVDAAKTEPPPEGRAHLRGTEIRRRSGRSSTCSADWQVIIDRKLDQICDMSDPFAATAHWRTPDGDSRLWQMVRQRRERTRP